MAFKMAINMAKSRGFGELKDEEEGGGAVGGRDV
jgi:hypothetical protein